MWGPCGRTARSPLPRARLFIIASYFGLEPLGPAGAQGPLKVFEDRYGIGGAIIASQLDPKDWHAVIGDETVTDAICDRLVHGVHQIELMGESLRKGMGREKPAK